MAEHSMYWKMTTYTDVIGAPFQKAYVTTYGADGGRIFLGIEDCDDDDSHNVLLLNPDEALKLARKLLKAYALVADHG